MVEQLQRDLSLENVRGADGSWPLIAEFMDYLRQRGMAEGSLGDFPGPVKHFLVWLDKRRIRNSTVDIDVVQAFFSHKCNCVRPRGERYLSRHMGSKTFRSCILQFVGFLEDTGRLHNPISLADAQRRTADFISYLGEQGYAAGTLKHYGYSCQHFVTWLHQCRITLESIDDDVLEQFTAHECLCPGLFVQNARRDQHYQQRVRRFGRFLMTTGMTSRGTVPKTREVDMRLQGFREWLRRHRGIGERRISAHLRMIEKLLPYLGDDPARYDATLVNRIILQNLENTSRVGAQQMCGSLRMYLRYLASTGRCSPALIGAIPRIPRWRLATLPRYILNDDVERVIASCDLTTPRGLRDRAILLLLARLALRAGDVANLRLQDIDWDRALISVAGKTNRMVALPLPQDAGDALLTYIEHGRPAVKADKIFIRTIAPFVPFSCSSPISIVVRDALKRAGVKNANLRGAYLLRHSAATNMLRTGATLDAVGAVLRHRSPETTAIYAKVDTSMLAKVVQPWIGSATCR